jgi:hypothetical protein
MPVDPSAEREPDPELAIARQDRRRGGGGPGGRARDRLLRVPGVRVPVLSPLADVVASIMKAENEGDRTALDTLLAEDFAGITRSGGTELGRADFLAGIEEPSGAGPWRSLEPGSVDVLESGDLGVVRCVMAVTHRAESETTRRFRNIFVVRRTGGDWRCVAWQVTRLD